jgi:hypothetical protein
VDRASLYEPRPARRRFVGKGTALTGVSPKSLDPRKFPPGVEVGLHDPYRSALIWTTNVLTTATLVYACGVGITAGAGTKRVLHLILPHLFKVWPFQTPKSTFPLKWKVVISFHYFSLIRIE